MSMECQQMSNSDGTCQMAWEEDDNGNLTWDTENYPVDNCGQCGAEDAEFPGDICDSYQPDLAGEYCERCGEYLGYDTGSEDDTEESECRCG